MARMSPEEAQAIVRAKFGSVVEAKPLREPVEEDDDYEVIDLLTRVCYFYPQYTLEDADRLTSQQVNALLAQAEKQRAIDLYNHTLINAAPHSKKGKLIKELVREYKKVIES